MNPTKDQIAQSAENDVRNARDEKIGLVIAEMLELTLNDKFRYDTLYGDRTAIGLARTIKAIYNEFEA